MYPYIYKKSLGLNNDNIEFDEFESKIMNWDHLFSMRCVSEVFSINKRKARKIVRKMIKNGYINRFKRVI